MNKRNETKKKAPYPGNILDNKVEKPWTKFGVAPCLRSCSGAFVPYSADKDMRFAKHKNPINTILN